MALVLVVNGTERALDGLQPEAALEAVVVSLGLQADRVAVEWNGEIVRRRDWGTTMVRSGDRLEVVHFVGGGTSPAATHNAGADLL